MAKITKPPIGVMPEWIHIERRMRAIKGAIERREGTEHKPLPEWFTELALLNRRLETIKR